MKVAVVHDWLNGMRGGEKVLEAILDLHPEADVYTLFARTTPGAGTKGITAFIVSGDAKGLSGSAQRLLSSHPIGRLALDGVFVAEDRILNGSRFSLTKIFSQLTCASSLRESARPNRQTE